MNEKTAINSTSFVVADLKDVDVEGMIFEGNSNIEYLPSRLFLQFPNLLIYKAAECSVNEINKENFEELTRLKVIDLSFNRIRKISGNTFLELESLLFVNLSAILIWRCSFSFIENDFCRKQSNIIDEWPNFP